MGPKIARGRGRPLKPLANDPDRYLLAAMQAHIECASPGLSESHILETFAGLRYGQPVGEFTNVEAMTRGEEFRVVTSVWRGADGSKDWRNRNAFRPIVDDMRKKLRRFRTAAPDDSDRRWLAAMTRSWCICLRGESANEGDALYFAQLADEGKYFEEVMRPILFERSEQRKRGIERADIRLPDFLRIFFPTT
jgi:hypothetical protein